MKKILFYTRNTAEEHVVVKNVYKYFKSIAQVNVIPFKSFFKKFKNISKEYDYVYHDDPIAYLFFSILGRKTKKIFHSIEMYEYQVTINSPKRVFRFFVFWVCHKYALRNAWLIIFPNALRRDFYLGKYKWIDVKKTAILENIPRELTEFSLEHIPESKVVLEFTSRFRKTLIITGAIGEGREIEKIIDLFSKQAQYGLCIITQSDVKVEKSSSILIFRNLPHASVLGLYKYFDAGLLSYENYPLNVKFCAPTKMYEYWASGLYIIGNANYSLVNNNYCDFIFSSPDEVLKFMEIIGELRRKERIVFDFDQKLKEIIDKFEINKED